MTDLDPEAISSWLSEHGRSISRLEPLTGDVSARRYARARLDDGGTAIVASYPVDLCDSCLRFERSTAILHRAGIAAPEILASDCGRGLMLLEDAGAHSLFELRGRPLDERLPMIRTAIRVAAMIAALDPVEVAELNPRLDADHLGRELRQTVEAFLGPFALLGGDPLRGEIELAFDRLCTALGAARPVPCHRDFMARNLMPGAGGTLLVLDHQDLRLGPPSYDLASLLNDSFYPPHDLEARWIESHLPDSSARHGYHRAAAQRTLKAVGTFAAFATRGSDRHLPLIPPTLERALHHLALAPETVATAPVLERLWRPWLESARAGL